MAESGVFDTEYNQVLFLLRKSEQNLPRYEPSDVNYQFDVLRDEVYEKTRDNKLDGLLRYDSEQLFTELLAVFWLLEYRVEDNAKRKAFSEAKKDYENFSKSFAMATASESMDGIAEHDSKDSWSWGQDEDERFEYEEYSEDQGNESSFSLEEAKNILQSAMKKSLSRKEEKIAREAVETHRDRIRKGYANADSIADMPGLDDGSDLKEFYKQKCRDIRNNKEILSAFSEAVIKSDTIFPQGSLEKLTKADNKFQELKKIIRKQHRRVRKEKDKINTTKTVVQILGSALVIPINPAVAIILLVCLLYLT